MPLNLRLKYIILLVILNALTYFGIQNLVSEHGFDFLLPIDNKIPLIPEFIWIYNSLVPVLIFVAAGLVKTKRVFYTTALSFVLAMIVLDICYLLLPSFYPREAFEVTGLSTWFLEVTRQIDGSNNTFPSGHVTLAWLLFWGVAHSKYAIKHNYVKWLTGLWAVGISVSTLVLKQHYFVDVVGGIVLAAASFYTAKWLLKGSKFIQKYPDENVGALSLEPEAQLAE